MKIRSVTIFNGRRDARSSSELQRSGRAAVAIRKRLQDAGFEVQTTRLALAPAWRWSHKLDTAQTVRAARELEAGANSEGIDYVSIGPLAEAAEHAVELEKLAELIGGTKAIFTSAIIAGMDFKVMHSLLPVIARGIKAVSTVVENGFGNLRFAALANCNAIIPFFPAAYSFQNHFSCALAMECADLALDCASTIDSAPEALLELSKRIEAHAGKIETALAGIKEETGADFFGCDWSLAPHPDPKCSIGAAIEKLSGAKFGEAGTLSAVAGLTHAIRNARVRHVGFKGVFLPLLEDSVLAQRTKSMPNLQTILLYSSVCGSGLDTVPLAGEVSVESITGILGDVATLATVLNKPLTARLMPIPGLKVGEPTTFDFPYLVNGHTLNLSGGGLRGVPQFTDEDFVGRVRAELSIENQ